ARALLTRAHNPPLLEVWLLAAEEGILLREKNASEIVPLAERITESEVRLLGKDCADLSNAYNMHGNALKTVGRQAEAIAASQRDIDQAARNVVTYKPRAPRQM